MKLTLATPGPYALFDLVQPLGSEPVPVDFDAVEELDLQARTAYTAGHYRLAAALFSEIASLLVATPEAAHAATLATDRAYSLRNAESATTMAGFGVTPDRDPRARRN